MPNTVTALVRDVATGNTEQMNMPMTDGELAAALSGLVTDEARGARLARMWGLWDAEGGPDTLNSVASQADEPAWANEVASLLVGKDAGTVAAVVSSGLVSDLLQLANVLVQWDSVTVVRGTPAEVVAAYLSEHADPEAQTILPAYLDVPGLATAVADVGAASEGYEFDMDTFPDPYRWGWDELTDPGFDPDAPAAGEQQG